MATYAETMLATGPVAWWRLGEAAGTTAVDSSGNGRHGTYVGGPTLGQPGLIVDADTAVAFDGVNDQVTVPQHPSLQITGALTVQAWINQSASKQVRIIYEGSSDGANVRLYDVYVSADGRLGFTYYNGSGYPAVSSPPGVVTPGATHHVAATRTAGMFARLYVDGVEVGQGQMSGTPPGTPTHFTVAAFGSGSQFFNGTVDEVAVHNVALTPEQIAGLHSLGAYGPMVPAGTRPARRYHRTRRVSR